MLPAIDGCGTLSYEEVPYRLPSTSKSFGRKRDQLQTCSEKTSRCFRQSNATPRAHTTINCYTRGNTSRRTDVSQMSRIVPNISSSPEVLDYNGSRRQYKIGRHHESSIHNDRLFYEMENIFCGSKKLLWIDELNQWILEDPYAIDYLKLSKKAKLFENEMIHTFYSNQFPKMKLQDEVKLCKIFSNGFTLKEKPEIKKQVDTYDMINDTKKTEANESTLNTISQINKKSTFDIILKDTDIEIKENDVYPSLSNVSNECSVDEEKFNVEEKESLSEEINQAEEYIIISDLPETKYTTDKNFQLMSETILPTMDIESTDHTINDIALLDPNVDISMKPSPEQSEENEKQKIDESITTTSETVNIDVLHSKPPEISEISSPPSTEKVKITQRFTHRVMFNFTKKIDLIDNNENDMKRKSEKIVKDEYSDLHNMENESEPIKESILLDMSDIPVPEVTESQEVVDTIEKEVKPKEVTDNDRDIMAPLLSKPRRRWGKRRLDSSYKDQLEREKLAERRKFEMRKKLQFAIEKSKRKKSQGIPDAPRFESYGFLAKYCILTKIDVGLYRYTFDVFDEDKKQWLTNVELMRALKGVNPNLKDYEVDHINMVMQICGYNTKSGADFKLFSVLAALTDRVTNLDSWIKSYIGTSEIKLMQKKLDYCRKLWECLVDSETNTLSMRSLCVELKAGGVTRTHIDEVHNRLGRMMELNLIDFLTYIPLFITMHMSIIDNPLDMTERI